MKSKNISLQDALAVIESISQPNWRALFLLMLDTAARYSEIAALTWEQVPKQSGGISAPSRPRPLLEIRIEPHLLPSGRLWRPKRPASIRSIKIGADARAAFRLVPQGPKRTLIFFPAKEEPTQSRTANYILENACLAVGVAPFSTHQLRRIRLTQALAAGADPNTVRAAAGHRSLSTTMRYLEDVPILAELPPLRAEPIGNPAAQGFLFLARPSQWKNT